MGKQSPKGVLERSLEQNHGGFNWVEVKLKMGKLRGYFNSKSEERDLNKKC